MDPNYKAEKLFIVNESYKKKNISQILKKKINIEGVEQTYDLDGTTVEYYNTLTNTVIARADERMFCFDGTTLNAIGLLK